MKFGVTLSNRGVLVGLCTPRDLLMLTDAVEAAPVMDSIWCGDALFVNIQHPGESPSERSDPAEPRKISNWPDFHADGRPRSATVVIRKNDGGVVGT